MAARARFGDEQSSLLDEFERLSIEAHAAQLSRVMLGRSLSEPKFLQNSQYSRRFISVAPTPLVNQVMQGPTPRHRRGLGFHKVLKKLLKPILAIKRSGATKQQQEVSHDYNNKDLLSFKAFSKSLRF